MGKEGRLSVCMPHHFREEESQVYCRSAIDVRLLLSKVMRHRHIDREGWATVGLCATSFLEEESHVYCRSAIDVRLLVSKVMLRRHIDGEGGATVGLCATSLWRGRVARLLQICNRRATPTLQSDASPSHRWGRMGDCQSLCHATSERTSRKSIADLQ